MATADAVTIVKIDSGMAICRLCADVSSSKAYTPLYTKNKEELLVTKQINQLVTDLIAPNDGLPQQACFKCSENVSKCFKYITNVIETQNKLRQMIQMPDLEDKNHSTPSPNQFLENNQSASATDVDFDLRTRNDYKSRLYRTEKAISPGENTTEALSKNVRSPNESSVKTISANDAYLQRLRSCAFKSLSADVQNEDGSARQRLFRCGICYGTFVDKEACLHHIVDQHSEVNKPVQPDTIFEKVRKPYDSSGDASSVANKSSSQPGAVTTLTNGLSASHAYSDHEYSCVAGDKRSPRPRPTPSKTNSTTKRSRKVLAIDSFYVEVKKPCTKYVCDDCGRMMVSRFAFIRHKYDHQKQPASEPVDERDDPLKQRKRPVVKVESRYCKICRKTVKDGSRHTIFHKIMRWELKYPNSAKLLSES